MDRMNGLRLLKTSFKSAVGIMSTGLEEGCICDIIRERSSNEIILNWDREETGEGPTTKASLVGVILDRILSILLIKKDKKCSQSSSEKTGIGGGGGFTRVLMTAKRVLGLFLLVFIKFEKYEDLASSIF